jgi:hypothetical protein
MQVMQARRQRLTNYGGNHGQSGELGSTQRLASLQPHDDRIVAMAVDWVRHIPGKPNDLLTFLEREWI